MKAVFLAALSIAFFSGCVSRPSQPPQHPPGLAQKVLPIGGAALGAAVGYNQNGSKGAVIGAAAGALVGAVTGKVVENIANSQIDDAAEQAARKERIKLMNDYWQSHAIDGGNAPKDGEKKPAETTVTYPPGVYDGVYYGPREVSVPRI